MKKVMSRRMIPWDRIGNGQMEVVECMLRGGKSRSMIMTILGGPRDNCRYNSVKV